MSADEELRRAWLKNEWRVTILNQYQVQGSNSEELNRGRGTEWNDRAAGAGES